MIVYSDSIINMKKTLKILSLSLVVSSSFAFGAFATEKPLPDFSRANPVAVRQVGRTKAFKRNY